MHNVVDMGECHKAGCNGVEKTALNVFYSVATVVLNLSSE